jgi:cytidine deaminase
MTPTALIAIARTAAKGAYAPYSNFSVGAAILLSDGQVVTGANFENASYGLSLCAETVALAKASNEGRLADVVEIAVTGLPSNTPIRPCGRCRQILNEAAQLGHRDIIVHCASGDGSVAERHMLSALIPHAFGPADLGVTA